MDLVIIQSGAAQNQSSERTSAASASSLSSPSKDIYDEYPSSVCKVDNEALPSMSSGGLVFFLHIPKVRLLFVEFAKTSIP